MCWKIAFSLEPAPHFSIFIEASDIEKDCGLVKRLNDVLFEMLILS